MGCDIHFYAEKRVDGKWVSADQWEHEDGYSHVPSEKEFYNSRNYDLFAILADVRNGRGFAGCKTGNGFNPISHPKGLPEDVSAEVKVASDEMSGDGHSHSWFTLVELLTYDWTQVAKKRGWVNGILFYKWKKFSSKEGEPDSWCGGVSGEDVKHVSVPEMEALVQNTKETDLKNLSNTYCLVEWEIHYYEVCRWFLSETIFKLLRLGKPEDVRIVFFFDN